MTWNLDKRGKIMRYSVNLLLALAAVLTPASGRASELRFFEDASLRAVQYVGETEAWAAGDEGVILHTIDGGKTWERVPSGTRGSLRSICFVTPLFGWIVGREEMPRGGSAGVVLVTTDGGVKWHRVLANTMPGLNRIKFVSGKEGFLMGDGTDHSPSGLFKTEDGGRTWKPVAGPRSTTWHDGDFVDGDTGALGGAWSRLAKLRLGQITTADVDTLGGRAVRGVRLTAERGLAVGDGGLLLLSKTNGASWGYGDLKLPADVLANMDFHAIDSVGRQVWVAGRPGSVILHSVDGGLNWEQQSTGQPLPLYSIYFRDESHGLAVGALGLVLSTSDGGRTWKVQRQGGQRAAALFIHADGTGVPLETVAHLGLEEGYLVTGLRVLTADAKTAAPEHATDEARLAAAVRLAGGAAAEALWQFPLPQHLENMDGKALIAHWDSLHSKQGAEQVLRQLVLALRVWRPEVIITDAADTTAGSVVAQAVQEAVKLAADPEAFPGQLKHLHLQPWKVAKVYSLWSKQNTAQVEVDGNALKNRLLSSLRDYSFPAASLMSESPHVPGQRYFRLLESTLPGAAAHKRLMAGVEGAAGDGGRRKMPPDIEPEPALLKAIQAQRQMQILAENPTPGLIKPEQILGQLKPVLSKLPPEQGAAAAFALAKQYVRSGQWPLAQEVFLTMADQFPAHPLTAEAYRWLIQHNTSSEARRRHELGQYIVTGESGLVQAGAPRTTKPGQQAGDPESTSDDPKFKYVNHQQKTYLSNQADFHGWHKAALECAGRLGQFGALHREDPATQFCLLAAHRSAGDFKKATDLLRDLKNLPNAGPWRQAAEAESWLASRSGLPSRPLLECRPAAARPYLDGEFNDPCWQGMKPVVLQEAVNKSGKEHRTEVRMAFDQEFLYLALTCTHPAGFHAEPAKARARDEDLRAYDRVCLLLDLDRDYTTYYRLQVDQRGCVCEDCWGDVRWNPRWFVAVRSNATSWSIEAAIPLSELTARPVTLGTAWACNVVRVLPGRGVQALSLPADVEPRPEGMGLLLFNQNVAPQKVLPASHIMPTIP